MLRTFLEVNRTRHFGRSAEALHITQAAVSSRIKSLEQLLGVRLFERTTRAINLTPEGRRLINHAERQIAAWRAARQDVSYRQSTEQLILGGSLRLWDPVLQPWLRVLRDRFPTLALIAEAQAPEQLTRRLIDATLDVAVMLEPAQLDILQIREIGAVDLRLVSTRGNDSLESAVSDGYVYVDWGLSHGLDHRRAFPDAPEAMTRVSQAKMALDLILQVGGSAYLPRSMVADEITQQELHVVRRAPRFVRKVYATYLLRSTRLELVENSIELIRSSSP